MDVVRTISWSKTGLKQRNKVFEYWDLRNESVAYSSKLNIEIRERTQLLKTNSKLGVETIFPNTRTISMGHYSILYKITEKIIIITGFWDNRRNPKKLLKFLKKTNDL